MRKILLSAVTILLAGCMLKRTTLNGIVQEVHETSILIAEKTWLSKISRGDAKIFGGDFGGEAVK